MHMVSPPLINVAEVAILPLTVMYFFLSAFFRADLVKAVLKIPTPYSCSRIGDAKLGTLCFSVGLILFLVFIIDLTTFNRLHLYISAHYTKLLMGQSDGFHFQNTLFLH